jgi:OPT family oligopeptide transporter
MSVLTFDWTQIAYIGSPMMVPWWAELHIFGGFILFYWIMVPIFYYTNVWNFAYFPLWGVQPFDNTGNEYNVSRVLTKDDTFDLEAFEKYSPLYLTATYATTYLLAFALSTCIIVQTILYHGHSLLNSFKRVKVEKDDIHAKLMRNYPEVPNWWYMLVIAFFFSMAIIACEVWKTGVPVWSLAIAVLLPCIYVIPNGFIFAMTGQGVRIPLLL